MCGSALSASIENECVVIDPLLEEQTENRLRLVVQIRQVQTIHIVAVRMLTGHKNALVAKLLEVEPRDEVEANALMARKVLIMRSRVIEGLPIGVFGMEQIEPDGQRIIQLDTESNEHVSGDPAIRGMLHIVEG